MTRPQHLSVPNTPAGITRINEEQRRYDENPAEYEAEARAREEEEAERQHDEHLQYEAQMQAEAEAKQQP